MAKIPIKTAYTSYSLAKSFISALIGVAIDEGYIKSVNDLAKDYLPNLSKEENYKNLTINHLLNHTSGIKSDLKIDAHLYYGRDLIKGIKKLGLFINLEQNKNT